MTFVAAKCPSCGASLKVPDNKDYVVCEFCKSNVKVREAIRLYTEVDIPDWLILAESAMNMGKYSEGFHYYIKILEVDAKVAKAWLGRAEATGKLLLQNTGNLGYNPQIIRNPDGSTHIITTNNPSSSTRTVHLRNTSGQFKDIGQIFAEIGKAIGSSSYYDQSTIQKAFRSYNDYLTEVKAYINNAERFAEPGEIEEIKSKSVEVFTEIISGIYDKLKSSYSQSFLSHDDLFPGYLDFTTGYLSDLETIRQNDPDNIELIRQLYRISSENVKTADDFLAARNSPDPRLSDFRNNMSAKESEYMAILEEAARK